MSSPDFVLTLVHGTFEPGAPWAQRGSLLCSRLETLLPGQVKFRPFDWTGGNNHHERLQGGKELAGFLAAGLVEHPSATHAIIAHSHGGNVSLYALSHAVSGVGARIAALVTMGTPFIRVKERAVPRVFRLLGLAIPALVAIALLPFGALAGAYLLGFAAGIPALSGLTIDETSALRWAFPISVALVAPIWWLIRRRLRLKTFPRVLARQEKIVQRLRPALSGEVPVLALTVRGDEAGWYLSRVYGVASIPFRLWKGRVFAGFYLFWFAVLTLGFALEPIDPAGSWMWFLGYLPTWAVALFIASTFSAVYLFVFALFLQLLMAIVPRVTRAHDKGFGGETITDNWYADIRTSDRPEATTPVEVREYSLSLPWRRRLFKRELLHSMLYADEKVLAEIAAWLGPFRQAHDGSTVGATQSSSSPP